MKKQYIIPATDIIDGSVGQLLATSTLDVINDQEITDSGDILSREGDFEDDDFDMDEENI